MWHAMAIPQHAVYPLACAVPVDAVPRRRFVFTKELATSRVVI
jgi:hypothetical protein